MSSSVSDPPQSVRENDVGTESLHDSPLEQDGFEPSVPRKKDDAFELVRSTSPALGFTRNGIGCDRAAEREPILWIKAILVLGRRASRHAEAMVGEHLAGTGDVAHDAVEDTPPVSVLVLPRSRKWRRKRPLRETPKASAWRMPVSPVRAPSAIIGFGVPRRSAWCARVCVGHAAEAGRTGGAGLSMSIGRPAAGSSASAAARRMPGRLACSPASG